VTLLAAATDGALGGFAAPALRVGLGLACLLTPVLVWGRSRWWARQARTAVRAALLFAAFCGLLAVGSWYPLGWAAGEPAELLGLLVVTALALAAVVHADRSYRPKGDPGWQLHLDRLRVLDTALNVSKDGVLLTKFDPKAVGLQIVYANPAFEELTGYGTEEAIGRSPSMLCNESSKIDRETVHTALRVGAQGRFEVQTRRKDGSRVWVEWNVVPVPDGDDGCAYRIAVLRDITERRVLEERLRHAAKLEVLGHLSAGIAHDFNNLLTVIRGSTDLLGLLTESHPSAPALVGEIRTATERASRLIRQLLTFGRPGTATRQVLDLNRVVAELTEILRRTAGPTIRSEVETTAAPLWVEADRSELEQVVMNLVVNARDAMPAGGRLRVRLTRAGDRAALEVSDTGSGIPDEVRARIFEPFFTTKGPDKGTGLGLATVHRVVHGSGGTIAVDSARGVGTTFRVELPLGRAPVRGHDPGGDDPASGAAGKSVLLVDDEPVVRSVARAILDGRGLRVTEAGDGTAALARLAAGQRFDVLVTDVMMPGAGGGEVAARARELAADIGVVFISGYADSQPSVPGSVFLSKPFSPPDLLGAVEKVLAAVPEELMAPPTC
jgi:PAS domain S-box-containing protein